MKRVSFLIFSAFISFANLTSCKFFSTSSYSKNKETKKTVYISLAAENFRTALPEVNWEEEWPNLTYSLTAIKNPGESTEEAPATIFTGRSYENLIDPNKGIELEVANYRFILDAYRGTEKSLTGVTTMNLSSGNSSLFFQMYPASETQGTVKISITFPHDGTVKSAKALLTHSFSDSPSNLNTENLTIKVYNGQDKVVYTKENVNSSSEQYLLFWFYDANGALVYSGAESIIIVGGYTSSSTITLSKDDWHSYLCTVSLKKNDAPWTGSGKTVSLVDVSDSNKTYKLKDVSGGNFQASVAFGSYYIYVNGKNTNVVFDSVDETATVDYYTISKTGSDESCEKGCELIFDTSKYNTNGDTIIIQKGMDFEYSLSLNQDYEIAADFSVSLNGIAYEDFAFNSNLTISQIESEQIISVHGINPIVYHITYFDGDKDHHNSIKPTKTTAFAYWWKSESELYTPPSVFTANEEVFFPTNGNLRKDDSFFDAWVDEDGNVIKSSKNLHSDITLYTTWKEAPSVNEFTKKIYANGVNLLITGDTPSTSDKTYIYVDFNGNGLKDDDDEELSVICTTSSDDFTGYSIFAGNSSGTFVPKSDFTVTMTGGKISSIYGLDSRDVKYPSLSILNISGTAYIGKVNSEGLTQTTTSNNKKIITATDVTGIMLETLSFERFNIIGQMGSGPLSTDYEINCVTPYAYDPDVEHIIAQIADSNYASFNNFTCWTIRDKDEEGNDLEEEAITYTKALLAQKNILQNGIKKTLVRMASDGGVSLPKPEEVLYAEMTGEFSLGQGTVSENCSVFSIRVENGTFRVNERTTITNNLSDTDKAVESTLTYMAQPNTEGYVAKPYVESFSYGQNYVYMQVLSSGNQLTSDDASDFLSQLYFKRSDPEVAMKVYVNLETVPSEFIQGNGDIQGGSEFKYFDGSFYKRIEGKMVMLRKSNSDGYTVTREEYYDPDFVIKDGYKFLTDKGIIWTDAYKEAKQQSFNGLKGYLINITSDVENSYIYDTFYKLYPDALSWTGGTRYEPSQTMTDSETGKTVPNYDLDTPVYKSTLGSTWIWYSGPEAGQVFWNKATCANASEAKSGVVPGVYYHWNNSTYLFSDLYNSDINNTNFPLRGNKSLEPNGNEPVMQFLAGNLAGKYVANGFWNNANNSYSYSDYKTTGYIVEFTPYETKYGSQVANYQAIKDYATY